VLDCKIVDSNYTETTENFEFSIGEYIYNLSNNGYEERTGFIAFEKVEQSTPTPNRKIFKVISNSYIKDTF
jgi:hypothetical protein